MDHELTVAIGLLHLVKIANINRCRADQKINISGRLAGQLIRSRLVIDLHVRGADQWLLAEFNAFLRSELATEAIVPPTSMPVRVRPPSPSFRCLTGPLPGNIR